MSQVPAVVLDRVYITAHIVTPYLGMQETSWPQTHPPFGCLLAGTIDFQK